MKKMLLSTALALSAATTSAQTITMADIPLTWNDFTVRNGVKHHPHNAEIAPWLKTNYIKSDAKRGENPILTISCELTLQPQKTWVKKEFIESATAEQKITVLNHEKAHLILFMIAFSELEAVSSSFEFSQRARFETDSIYKAIATHVDMENKRYDNETDHGRLTDKQAEWEARLLADLNQLYGKDKPLPTKFKIEKVIN